MTDQDRERLDALEDAKVGLFKRIDIGILTGICALFISFVGVITSRASFKMAQETQKARVLPIIDIDMGYFKNSEGRDYFEVTLNNVGAGIAHIQRVRPTQNGEPVATYQEFQDLTMNRRMRGWATLTERPAAGYLRAGESVTPHSMKIGGGEGDVQPYLRGDYGTPFDGLDLEACYCSVFEDCWTVKFVDRAKPKPVRSCNVGEVAEDYFQTYADQRLAKKQEKAAE